MRHRVPRRAGGSSATCRSKCARLHKEAVRQSTADRSRRSRRFQNDMKSTDGRLRCGESLRITHVDAEPGDHEEEEYAGIAIRAGEEHEVRDGVRHFPLRSGTKVHGVIDNDAESGQAAEKVDADDAFLFSGRVGRRVSVHAERWEAGSLHRRGREVAVVVPAAVTPSGSLVDDRHKIDMKPPRHRSPMASSCSAWRTRYVLLTATSGSPCCSRQLRRRSRSDGLRWQCRAHRSQRFA